MKTLQETVSSSKATCVYNEEKVKNNVAIDMFIDFFKQKKETNPCLVLGRLSSNSRVIKIDFRNKEEKFQNKINLVQKRLKEEERRLKETKDYGNVQLLRRIKNLKDQVDDLADTSVLHLYDTKEDNKVIINSSNHRTILSYINKELAAEAMEGKPVYLSSKLGYIQLVKIPNKKERISHFVNNEPVMVMEDFLYKLFWFKYSRIRYMSFYKAKATGGSGNRKCFRGQLVQAINNIKKVPAKVLQIQTRS